MLEKLLTLFKSRELLINSTLSEIKQKHAGTILGIWWLALTPLLLLGIYSIVYSVIFKVKANSLSQGEYLLYIFCGLIPYLHIAECLSMGSSSLAQNRQLFKNTVYPIEFIPMRAVLSNSSGFLIGILLIFLGSIVTGTYNVKMLLVPVIALLQMAFLFGAVWLLSLISLIIGDVRNILNFLIMITMILSPIAYTVEMVPSHFRFLIWLNPIAYFIVAYQQIIVLNAFPPLFVVLAILLISALTFLLGFLVFDRVKQAVVSHAG
jgi:lipopolysaccharide transport system permease protein